MAHVKAVKVTPIKPKKSAVHKKRGDRWINPKSGFGGASDPISRTYFGRDFTMSQIELDHLYEGDWVARRVIDIPAKDATREWITLSHDDNPEKANKMTEELSRLGVQARVSEAIKLARLYGGCAMILGAFDGQEVSEPLGTIEKVDWIANVDRFHAYPATFYQDPDDPRFGSPETYIIQRLSVIGSQTMTVHESRIVRFEGAYLPPRLRIRNFGWSAPIFQHVREALRQFGVSIQSGASILQDFITMKMKVDNLTEMLKDDNGENVLLDRIALIASERAIHNIMLYGSDEEVDKMGTPISGLPQLIDLYMDIMSAAGEVPKSRFFHNQTGRLGGDAGESDLRTHYDNMASFQKTDLTEPVQRIVDVVGEPLGHEPGEIKFEWNSLWQLSEADLAKQYQETATADVAYITAGVLQPEEVAINRFGGEGLNLGDMIIDTERRQKVLDAIKNQPIELDEPSGAEPGDDDEILDPDNSGGDPPEED